MQLLTSLTLLLAAFVELSSALVLSPELYNYDVWGSDGLRTEKLKSLKGIKKMSVPVVLNLI